jgi:tetratricopeptide (TPR) repeat protein
MKKLQLYFILNLLICLLFTSIANSQSKEYDKLKDMVDRGKLDKAQEYCDKVTAAMDPKTSGRFYALMGLAYYNTKNYEKSAEMLLKSNDKKLSAKLAKEFENENNSFYDLKTAGELYSIAEEYEKAAGLLFKEGKYEEAAKVCPSPDASLKFGKELFNQGKFNDALPFLKKAKKKGQKFSDEEVLSYYFNKKEYSTVYSIQNSGEGSFYLPIQGTVIDKMIEKNESNTFISHFLDSVNVKGNKQFEAFINGYVNNKMLDKAESYCLEQQGSNQQVALSFLAQITSDIYPDVSAWANLKSGKTLLGKQQITTYLVETALKYNSKWEQEPINKKVIEEYKKETLKLVKKCEQDYCQSVGFASTMSRTKSEETAKANAEKSADYSKAYTFLKVMEKNCK